jgi:hypothetical protein
MKTKRTAGTCRASKGLALIAFLGISAAGFCIGVSVARSVSQAFHTNGGRGGRVPPGCEGRRRKGLSRFSISA